MRIVRRKEDTGGMGACGGSDETRCELLSMDTAAAAVHENRREARGRCPRRLSAEAHVQVEMGKCGRGGRAKKQNLCQEHNKDGKGENNSA